jgi:ribosomal protein S18 acetylase RimI-like enzyme
MIQFMASTFLGENGDRRDPLANPTLADLRGLPPVYILVGGFDVLLDDSHALAEALRKADVDVTLEVYPEMQHTFNFLAGTAPEADQAISKLAMWVRPKLGLQQGAKSGGISSPLDRVVWLALSTKQRDIAEGDDLALRYPATISPLVAIADTSAASFASLKQLLLPGEQVMLPALNDITPPPDFEVIVRENFVQMVGTVAGESRNRTHLMPLGPTDVADMMALVEKTKPAPFRVRTHELGRYFGVRIDGQLVAMAGERMRIGGYTEIGAVCCHPAYRGRGYAHDLVVALSQSIFVRGEVPILHVSSENQPAIALYKKLGFTLRRLVRLHVLQRAA